MERWTGAETRTLRHALRMSVREFAGRLGITDRIVSRWEAAGAAMVPRPVNQAALDTLLEGADSRSRDRFFGELSSGTIEGPAGSSESEDEVRRREFLQLAAVATTTAWIPHAVTAGAASDIIGAIAGPTAHYRRLEQSVPSAHLADVVRGHAAFAASLVQRHLPTGVGHAALSELAGFTAWLAFDQASHAEARARYLSAITHAEQAEHELLGAYMRASLGAFATEAGDPRSGLALLEQSRSQIGASVPAPAHAWLSANLAVTHATLGEDKAARIELRRSHRLAAKPADGAEWPWIFTFDDAKAARYAATTLGLLGDVTGARQSYADAAPALTASKARALAQVDHATALADAGHVAEACDLAGEALTVATGLKSERIVSRVRTFRGGLPPRTHDARTLDVSLADLYRVSGGTYAPEA